MADQTFSVVQQGAMAGAQEHLAQLSNNTDQAEWYRQLAQIFAEILHGSRDPGLAEVEGLGYSNAEVLWLIERLGAANGG